MGRLLLALLIGLVGALIVHIGVIFAMPRLAEDNAWARLTRLMPPLRPTLLTGAGEAPALAPGVPQFAFTDPAFLAAACRFTVADGPVRLHAMNGLGFWSASINARSGDNVYSINERLAPLSRLDIVVGTAEQLETVRMEGALPEEESIPVAVTASEFYLTLRALVEAESERPAAERLVRSLGCEPIELDASADTAR